MEKEQLHRLLKRQLQKFGIEVENIDKQWQNFLLAVNDAYTSYDEDNARVERILENTTQENIEITEKLRIYSVNLEAIVEEKTQHLNRLLEDSQYKNEELQSSEEELRISMEFQSDVIDKLHDKESELDALIGSLDDIVFVIDRELNFTKVWAKNKDLLFFNEDAFLDKRIDEVFEPEFAEPFVNIVKSVLKTKKTEVIEYIAPYDNRWYRAKFTYVNNYPPKVTALISDISERKQQELETQKAREKAEQASKSKAMFLSMMSHEIRTPMNAVIGIASLLQETPLVPEQKKLVGVLKSSAENLLMLLNDILDIGKIEAGKLELEITDIHLKNMLMQLQQLHEYKAQEKGISLIVESDDNIPTILRGDLLRLMQIFNNLLSNAIKFTEKGEVRLEIHLKEIQQSRVILMASITDTGIGIDKAFHSVIFENFSQANPSMSRKYGGTGLGLPITKKLLEMMGSQIQVESQIGKGTKFFFEIVLEKGEQEIVNQSTNFTLGDMDLKGYRLLLVEDNQINILVLKQFLKKTEVTFDIAENGRVAIEKMRNDGQFDMILMDLEMPEVNGFQATEEIRKFNKTIPIIALTASAFPDVIEKALSLGVNDIITKPYEPITLYKKMKYHLPFKSITF
jgi:signal transduction histidine kinase